MRTRVHFCLLAALLCAASPQAALAEWGTLGVISQRFAPDARSAGMGQAATALAEGATAAYWNPGALGWQRGQAWAGIMPLTYTQLVPDLTRAVYQRSTAAAGSAYGLGLGFNLNDIEYGESTFYGDDGRTIASVDADEYTLHLGIGANLARLLYAPLPWLDWGVGLCWKHMAVRVPNFDTRPPTAFAIEASANDISFGTLVGVTKQLAESNARIASSVGLRFGAVLDNALDHEIVIGSVGRTDHLGKSYRLAWAATGELGRAGALGSFLQVRGTWEVRGLMGSANPIEESAAGDERIFGYGCEVGLLHLFTWRMGYVDDDRGGVCGRTYGLSLGNELAPRAGLRIDYASNPQVAGMQRTQTYTVSGWGRF